MERNLLLFDKNLPNQAYHTKERPCPRGCGVLIYFEARIDEQGNIITKDGEMPNGIFGKENNVKWFWRESISKSEHLIDGKCKTRTMVEEPTEKQVAFLKRKGVEVPSTKEEASAVISKLIGNSGKSYPSKEKQQTVLGGGSTEHGVKWEEVSQQTMDNHSQLLTFEQELESLAVHITSTLHPMMSKNSQTFGMIVSAKEDKLIQLLLIKELRNMREDIARLQK